MDNQCELADWLVGILGRAQARNSAFKPSMYIVGVRMGALLIDQLMNKASIEYCWSNDFPSVAGPQT